MGCVCLFVTCHNGSSRRVRFTIPFFWRHKRRLPGVSAIILDGKATTASESLGFWLGDATVKLMLLQGYSGRCMTQESPKIVLFFHSSFLEQDDANLSEREISTLFRAANADHGVRSNRGLLSFISRETRSVGPPEEAVSKNISSRTATKDCRRLTKMTLRCMMFLRYPT